MPELIYFDESHLELVAEVRRSPELKQLILDAQPQSTIEALGHIAAYCGIMIDGVYSPDDLTGLIEILIRKLREKRKIIVTLN